MDAKASLAVDAPPVAPYDDGFSTESEDWNDSEELIPEDQGTQLHIATPRSVISAAVVENQSHAQRQQILDLSAANSDNLKHKKSRVSIAIPAIKNGEKAAQQAAIDLKTVRNGHVTAREEVQITGLKREEKHCRSCKGYLTPLVERAKMMEAAALRHSGEGPPPTKQCSCCRITYPLLALTAESKYAEPRCYMCNWAARAVKKVPNQESVGVKRTRSEDVKVTHVDRVSVDEKEGSCRTCKTTLAPLARRIRVMKEAVLHHKKRGAPPTKQCSCCHITYPISALTLKSREPSCRTPICFLCGSASMEATTSLPIAGTTAVKPEASAVRQNGAVATPGSAAAKGIGEAGKKEADGDCRKCKRKLPTVGERRRMMKATLQHIKDDGRNGNRPLRKCSCCRILYPLSSLTEKSRNIKCTSPICYACDGSSAPATTKDEVAPPRSDTAAASDSVDGKTEILQGTKKFPEIIVVDGGDGDEEGELVEERICKCCSGQLTKLVDRLRMMKDATLQHGGKRPPSSRQCACCRITYPSAALTANSRKMTRVVPICLKCCRAGGSAIYEMLAASDEFIEAFKVENPEMARLLLKKKESGMLAKTAENQRQRTIKKQRQPKKALPAAIAVQASDQVTPAANPRSAIPSSPYIPYGMKMARTPVGAPRQLLSSSYYASAALQRPVHDPRMMTRKHIGAPRQLLASSYYANAATLQAGLHIEQRTETKQQPAAQQGSVQEPQRPRSSRWLQQFEIIDGKTTRERRLEARIATRERQLEKKQQRTK